MEEVLLEALAKAWVHGQTGKGSRRQSCSASALCQKANSYLRAHQDQPVYLHEICGALEVSPRTLNYAFRAGFGVSPMRYLRLRRLQQVRQQLLVAQPGDTLVKVVALGAGFCDLGRFSAEYRQMFRECPSETLRVANGSGLEHPGVYVRQ